MKKVMKNKLQNGRFVRAGVYGKMATVVDSHLDNLCDEIIAQAESQGSISILPHHVDAAIFKMLVHKNKEE